MKTARASRSTNLGATLCARALSRAGLVVAFGCATAGGKPAETTVPAKPGLGAFSVPSSPDAFVASQPLGPGTQPRLAIDYDRRIVHLVYVKGHDLLYRTAPLDGAFGPAEVVMSNPNGTPNGPPGHPLFVFLSHIWDPHLVLDGGVPHVVASDGHYLNRFTWYTNRVGGGWKPRLAIVDRDVDQSKRTTTPHLAARDGVAFVATFTTPEGKPQLWGVLARVEDLAGTPRIAIKRKVTPWNPQIFFVDGALWAGGRNPEVESRFTLQRHDPQTLTAAGEHVRMSGPHHGEMARSSVDHTGDVHVAGTLNGAPYETSGWYNSLRRAQAGQPAINYKTTNKNANGAGLPIRDRVAKDRVYVFHWSGAIDEKHHEPLVCAPGNQVRFMRVENGVKAVEDRPVTDRPTSHGESKRQAPGVVAHPDGGALVVFEECAAERTLHVTRVGGGGASLASR